MHTTYLRRWGTAVVVLVVIAAPLFISWLRRRLSRRIRHPSGQALIRYIQLHDQCSEEAAYQRLAVYVKRHVPPGEWSSVDYMLAYDRQRLLELAQRILIRNPDEIDVI